MSETNPSTATVYAADVTYRLKISKPVPVGSEWLLPLHEHHVSGEFLNSMADHSAIVSVEPIDAAV